MNPWFREPAPESVDFSSGSSVLRDGRLWAILTGQFLLNIFFLSQRTLWLDEAYSALMARRSFPDLYHILRDDAGPPLYYALLHGWRAVWGESPIALRGFSLLFALLTTVLIYAFAMSLWNHRVALYSALIFAFSPLTTAYSGETRNYTLLAFLSLAFTLFWIRYLLHGKQNHLLMTGFWALLLIYTHNIGWFLIAAGFLISGFTVRNWKRTVGLAFCFSLTGIFYIPWLPVLLRQMQNTVRTIAWVKNFWSPYAPLDTFRAFLPGGITPAYLALPSFPVFLQIANGLLGATFVGLCILHVLRTRERCMGWVVLLFILGLAGPYLFSLFKTPIYLAGRTDYGLFPLGCLIAGYGLTRLPWPGIRLVLAILFLFQMVWIDGRLLLQDDPYSERDAILYLRQHAQPGDIILCTGLTRPSLEYALASKNLPFYSYPRGMRKHLAHLNEALYIERVDLTREAEDSLQEAIQSLAPRATLWIAGSHRPINQPLWDFIRGQQWLEWQGEISTPHMGLRKLGEPIFLWRIQVKKSSQ